MTREVGWHPPAEAEFAADVDWYDSREVDSGGAIQGRKHIPWRVVFLADADEITLVAARDAAVRGF